MQYHSYYIGHLSPQTSLFFMAFNMKSVLAKTEALQEAC